MDKKNLNIKDIYTSYGSYVGKVCENTNSILCKDNNIESLTSSINELMPNDNLLQEPLNLNVDLKIPKNTKTVKYQKISNSDNNLKNGGNNTELTKPELTKSELTKPESTIPELNDKIEEQTNFFTYKIHIFNYKISIWILILIILVIICICYFVYKYLYLKNDIIVSYKKNQQIDDTKQDNDDDNSTSDNSTNDNSTSNKSNKSNK